MLLLFLLIVLTLLALMALWWWRRGVRPARAPVSPAARWPYRVRRGLSEPEMLMYQRLVQAFPGHVVLARVPLNAVLGVRQNEDVLLWMRRLEHKLLHFVVCLPDARVLFAIELDDRGDDVRHRRSHDAVKSRACADAGLRLVRWHIRALPDVAELHREFRSVRAVTEGEAAGTRPGALPDEDGVAPGRAGAEA